MLTVLDSVPSALLDVHPRGLADVVPELSLIHLDGKKGRPVVVAFMLHGNEPGGLYAVQQVLRHLPPAEARRGLTLLVGNVEAARHGLRRLDDQPDYNRIWSSPTGRSRQVLDELAHHGAFCVLDVHNSSGVNPCFVGLTTLDRTTYALAQRFSEHLVHVSGPTGMLCQATGSIAPSLTLECGAPTSIDGPAKAAHLILDLLVADALPETEPGSSARVLENVAMITVDGRLRIGALPDADVELSPELEAYNFVEVAPGTAFARSRGGSPDGFAAVDPEGRNIAADWIRFDDGRIIASRPMVPVMMTLEPDVIKKDCLGYIMQRRDVELP